MEGILIAVCALSGLVRSSLGFGGAMVWPGLLLDPAVGRGGDGCRPAQLLQGGVLEPPAAAYGSRWPLEAENQ